MKVRFYTAGSDIVIVSTVFFFSFFFLSSERSIRVGSKSTEVNFTKRPSLMQGARGGTGSMLAGLLILDHWECTEVCY